MHKEQQKLKTTYDERLDLWTGAANTGLSNEPSAEAGPGGSLRSRPLALNDDFFCLVGLL